MSGLMGGKVARGAKKPSPTEAMAVKAHHDARSGSVTERLNLLQINVPPSQRVSTMDMPNDWAHLPQQPLHHYSSRSVHVWNTSSVSKSLRDFSYPLEVLQAVKDAICDHKKAYLEFNKLHGNITPDSIRIGHNPNAHESSGFLAPPHMHEPDPTFQSFRSLSHLIGRRRSAPADYLDDLESFFYVIIYMSYGFFFPHGAGGRPEQLNPMYWAQPLSRWALRPLDRVSIVDKEMVVQNQGVDYNGTAVPGPWGGVYFLAYVLNELGICVGKRYMEMIDREEPITQQEHLEKATFDYNCFISVLDKYLRHFSDMQADLATLPAH